jgi:SAM-dependent methyltransferase
VENKMNWNSVYEKDSSFFGEEPSTFATTCYNIIKGKKNLLELGGGQGRDCLFFASKGIKVTALDSSNIAIDQLSKRAKDMKLEITTKIHDISRRLPFDDNTFDVVYSHMFFSMEFEWKELEFIFEEVRRVLRNDGYHFFSVRNQNDKFYGKGIKKGEIYEIHNFRIRFFSKEEIEKLAKEFKIQEIKEDYEEPVTLYLVSSKKK